MSPDGIAIEVWRSFVDIAIVWFTKLCGSMGLVTSAARRVTIRWVLRGSRATTIGW
jgi:hypothetical protein